MPKHRPLGHGAKRSWLTSRKGLGFWDLGFRWGGGVGLGGGSCEPKTVARSDSSISCVRLQGRGLDKRSQGRGI